MTFLPSHRSIVCLLGIACLIGMGQAQAQSRDDARKRSFADLLARRAKTAQAEPARAIAAAPHTKGRTDQTTSLARSTSVPPRIEPSTSPIFAKVAPLAAGAGGVSSATPVTPSGFGPGRVAFVESLYFQILGRHAHRWEVNYWSRVLAKGVSTSAVANLIWNSREHRSLLRNHEAPGIPLGVAYNNAIAYSKTHQQ